MLQNNVYDYTDMFEASVRVGRRICAEELAKMFFCYASMGCGFNETA